MSVDIKTDCFAYDSRTISCNALNELYCLHDDRCAFYKTSCCKNDTIKADAFYQDRLRRWFDHHYGKFADTAELFPDPAYNAWEFYIPELKQIITMRCSEYGRVTVERKEVNE